MLKLISPTFEDIKTWYQLKEYSKRRYSVVCRYGSYR